MRSCVRKMVTTLIQIRLKQLDRQSTSSSFMCGLLVIVAAIVGAFCYFAYTDQTVALIICCAVISVVLSLHLSRGDSGFVYHHIAQPQQAIFMEYLLFAAPLSLPALFTSQWYCVPIIIASLAGIAQIKHEKKERVRLKRLSAIISPLHFELLSGFRKNVFPVMLCYVLAFAFCWVRILPLFLLWLITVQVMAFYNRCEPLDMLRANDISITRLLRLKIVGHSITLILLYSPVVLLNAYFNEGFWWINAAFLLLQVSLICFAICYKYSVYTPNTQDGGSILFGLIALSGIVPFLLPLPAIMGTSYYFRAKQNLNHYFND